MRQKLLIGIAFLVFVAGCGLKVPADQAQGQLTDGQLSGTSTSADGTSAAGSTGTDGEEATGSSAASSAAAAAAEAAEGASGEGGSAVPESTSLFPNNTEGLTNDSIKICTHVPITGAAPVDRNPKRFGAFYFDWLNKKENGGGIHGRKVEYLAFDDRYNPANAVQAAERCRSNGAFVIAGAAGTDQLVAVAKWARDKKVPYLMGPASVKDVSQYTPYAKMVGPDYEYQHDLLADLLVDRFGKNVNYAMIRVNSPFFTAAHDQFVKRLKEKHGITLAVDEVVEKDENAFSPIFNKLIANDVEVVNNFTTPVHWLKMMKQRPPNYKPTWTAVSPAAGFNLVAEILTGEGEQADAGDALVFHHFNPAYPASRTDDGNTISQPQYAEYADDIRKFKEVFAECDACLSEHNGKTPRDDIDWSAYLAAKSIHRLLEKAGPDISRTKLWTMLDTYKETPQEAAPACPGDFTRKPHRGAWFVNIFKLGVRQWDNVARCVDRV